MHMLEMYYILNKLTHQCAPSAKVDGKIVINVLAMYLLLIILLVLIILIFIKHSCMNLHRHL